MAWQDTLREASYKGVPFLFEEVRGSFGRATSVKRIPGASLPHTQDHGELPRTFALTAVLVGDDYNTTRDQLVDAIVDANPGTLVHPLWGSHLVRPVGEATITETDRDGGICRLEVTFVRIGQVGAFRRTDTLAQVNRAADAVQGAQIEQVSEVFSVANAIQEGRAAAATLVNMATEAISSVKATIDQAVGIIDEGQQLVAQLADSAEQLLKVPGELAASIAGAIQQVLSSVATLGDAAVRLQRFPDILAAPFASGSVADQHRAEVLMAAWRRLDAFEAEALEGVTGGQASAQEANAKALVLLVRVTAVGEAARVAGELQFDSVDQAAAVRDELGAAIDGLLFEVDDWTFATLQDLRASLTRRLTDAAATLPRVATFTAPRAMPMLVIAQRLYGDGTRDAEILARNPHVRNPALVGEALQVLSR